MTNLKLIDDSEEYRQLNIKTKSKPCDYYQIKASEFLAFVISDCKTYQDILDFALQLVSGECNSDYAKRLIENTNKYRNKKILAGKKGGLAKASTAKALPSTAKASLKHCSSKTWHTPSQEKDKEKDKEKKEKNKYIVQHDVERRVIAFFNLHCQKQSTFSESNIKRITSLLRKYTEHDIKAVVVNQHFIFSDPDFLHGEGDKYIRMTTLFGPQNFTRYHDDLELLSNDEKEFIDRKIKQTDERISQEPQ